MGQILLASGYSGLVGIDISPGMLSKAKEKPAYAQTHCMAFGEPLKIADETFAVTASLASLAPGPAGKDAFEELIRAKKRGGILVLALLAGCEELTGFAAEFRRLEESGEWVLIDEVADLISHPDAQPPSRYWVHVYRHA